MKIFVLLFVLLFWSFGFAAETTTTVQDVTVTTLPAPLPLYLNCRLYIKAEGKRNFMRLGQLARKIPDELGQNEDYKINLMSLVKTKITGSLKVSFNEGLPRKGWIAVTLTFLSDHKLFGNDDFVMSLVSRKNNQMYAQAWFRDGPVITNYCNISSEVPAPPKNSK